MSNINEYHNMLQNIEGKVIAIVYNFINEPAQGYKIYEAWKSDVLSSWMIAIDELGAIPFILDARTFISKTVNNTMPHVDYVVNLCNGLENISVLGIIPSICAFSSLPCIPNNAKTIMIGEDKRVSNYLANISGINLPKEQSIEDGNGIIRPVSLGSSIGVVKTPCAPPRYDYICQEFIEGYDMTIPVMFNPLNKDFEVLPGILYLPKNPSTKWFLGEKEKLLHNNYDKINVRIPKEVKNIILELAKIFQVDTYCRIDTRVRTNIAISKENISEFSFGINEIFFLEINTMPTIKDGINFHNSLANVTPEDDLHLALEQYRSHFSYSSITGFILSSSILAFDFKAKH